MEPMDVFDLDEGEEVCCYYCLESHDYTQYVKGQAFLAGPDHPPCDGNANYICKEHLHPSAVIVKR